MNPAPLAFAFELRIDSAHPALPGHFPGRPVVPGALLLAQVLSGVGAGLDRTVSVVRQVKFTGALLPDETASVACELHADELRFAVRAMRGGRRVDVAAGTLGLRGDST